MSRFLDLSEADPKYLRDVVLNFVMAGKDTTATTLSWFIYMMCKNPLSQEKAACEIEQVTCSDIGVNAAEFAESLSEESLEKMHYLHAALSETLRLYPPVPVVRNEHSVLGSVGFVFSYKMHCCEMCRTQRCACRMIDCPMVFT